MASRSLIFAVVFVCAGLVPAHATKSPYDWALVRLDQARVAKVAQLERFCERTREKGRAVVSDDGVVGFFEVSRKYAEARRSLEPPEQVRAQIEEARTRFDDYYTTHFFAFYDMVFIDMGGRAFYAVRHRGHAEEFLVTEDGNPTPLGLALAEKPTDAVFVDFHDCQPAGEPGAFLIEPVRVDGQQVGWVALLVSISRVNALFTGTQNLGTTGEAFLVNTGGYMLTQSYLDDNTSILKRHLSDENMEAKFGSGEGHRTVTDYRGRTALSSFEVFEFMGTRWLVVAKMDRDEVTTRHFAAHRAYYSGIILDALVARVPPSARTRVDPKRRAAVRVDMDEFLRVGDGQRIETWGVASCTALLAAYPGRFAYLAHISNRDRLYGGSETNLWGQMSRDIKRFRIYPYESDQLVFVVASPTPEALPAILGAIVDQGFWLSQVRVMLYPEARSGALVYDTASEDLALVWNLEGKAESKSYYHLDDTVNAGAVVERIIEGETPVP